MRSLGWRRFGPPDAVGRRPQASLALRPPALKASLRCTWSNKNTSHIGIGCRHSGSRYLSRLALVQLPRRQPRDLTRTQSPATSAATAATLPALPRGPARTEPALVDFYRHPRPERSRQEPAVADWCGPRVLLFLICAKAPPPISPGLPPGSIKDVAGYESTIHRSGARDLQDSCRSRVQIYRPRRRPRYGRTVWWRERCAAVEDAALLVLRSAPYRGV
jgi:hypothetical protein